MFGGFFWVGWFVCFWVFVGVLGVVFFVLGWVFLLIMGVFCVLGDSFVLCFVFLTGMGFVSVDLCRRGLSPVGR